MTTIDNGVNVQALLDAREVLAGAPEAAQFTWKATSKWTNGVHSQTMIQNFFGLGEEQNHKTEAVFDADHPVPPAKTLARSAVASVGSEAVASALRRRLSRKAGRMRVTAQCVADQDHVVPLG